VLCGGIDDCRSAGAGLRRPKWDRGFFGRLTFELSGRQRQDARPGLAKMYLVPPDRVCWLAVGAPLERGVRPQRAPLAIDGVSTR
jgi:hypothetical protein